MGILSSERDRLLKALSDRPVLAGRADGKRDGCEICHGGRGGVPGNENVVKLDGVDTVMCDYCTGLHFQLEGRTK